MAASGQLPMATNICSAVSGAERMRAINPRCARKVYTRRQTSDFDDDLADQILDTIRKYCKRFTDSGH
jgi:hypothetical protein